MYDDDLNQTRREQPLPDNVKRFRAIYAQSPIAIEVYDSEGLLIEANLACLTLFGVDSLDAVKGFKLFEDPNIPVDALKRLTRGEAVMYESNFDFDLVRQFNLYETTKSGRIHIKVFITPILAENRTLTGYLVHVLDITERKRIEEELYSTSLTVAELNKSLKLINQILRHDITNDLMVVQGYLELYQDEKDKQALEQASLTLQKSADLLKRMRELEYLVLREEELIVYDARQTVEAVLVPYVAEPIAFRVTGECRVLADPAFPSVLDNLIRNALVHAKTDRIDITITTRGEFCELRVADYGVGIPTAIQPKIFDPGVMHGTTGHMGLGLFIVKQVMERYGGSVRLEDNTPQGSVFVLKFRTEQN